MSPRRHFPGLFSGRVFWALLFSALVALSLVATACGGKRVPAQSSPGAASVTQAPPSSSEPGAARSVILFIGDGMDDQQLTMARDYLVGMDGEFSFDRFAERGAAKVQTVLEEDPKAPEYVADSANSATSIASGILTSRGRIGTTAQSDDDVVTVLELAQRAGKEAGLVTTSSITDATPASFAAHVRLRFCEGPDEMRGSRGFLPGCPDDLISAGGPGSIAEQLATSGISVLLGGGLESFDQKNEVGASLLEVAAGEGYRLVRTAAELESVHAEESSEERRTLGLFGAGTLPTEWAGDRGRVARPLALDAEGAPIAPEPFHCVDNPSFGARPTLEAMTRKALELLEPAEKGFFLMVESASIDKQAHAANPCGQIGETRALDQAVAAAVEYQQRHPDTLIIVTADHGHSAQVIPWPSLFDGYTALTGLAQYPSGKVALLETPEGGNLAVHYGTNKLFLEEHTGTQVPVFAQGPGADAASGLIRQRDLFGIMTRALGLE